ncbi:hypothetical protein CLU79DRAFT_722244 [Phycomyces nitens]|nr:hypothetical protein CLU79DRAFT_722244 [Phycomyces nitens]
MDHLQQVLLMDPLGTNNAAEWLLINIIAALVLEAAHQSLISVCPDMTPDIHHCSQSFYSQAHRQFWHLTYPVIPECEPDIILSQNLTRAAILIAHYQCTAISEDQALVTLRIGLGFAQRCHLSNYRGNPGLLGTKEYRLHVLYKTLIGWDTWFRFYLYQLPSQDTTEDYLEFEPMVHKSLEVQNKTNWYTNTREQTEMAQKRISY